MPLASCVASEATAGSADSRLSPTAAAASRTPAGAGSTTDTVAMATSTAPLMVPQNVVACLQRGDGERAGGAGGRAGRGGNGAAPGDSQKRRSREKVATRMSHAVSCAMRGRAATARGKGYERRDWGRWMRERVPRWRLANTVAARAPAYAGWVRKRASAGSFAPGRRVRHRLADTPASARLRPSPRPAHGRSRHRPPSQMLRSISRRRIRPRSTRPPAITQQPSW